MNNLHREKRSALIQIFVILYLFCIFIVRRRTMFGADGGKSERALAFTLAARARARNEIIVRPVYYYSL